jgi:hypothetical protein
MWFSTKAWSSCAAHWATATTTAEVEQQLQCVDGSPVVFTGMPGAHRQVPGRAAVSVIASSVPIQGGDGHVRLGRIDPNPRTVRS